MEYPGSKFLSLVEIKNGEKGLLFGTVGIKESNSILRILRGISAFAGMTWVFVIWLISTSILFRHYCANRNPPHLDPSIPITPNMI